MLQKRSSRGTRRSFFRGEMYLNCILQLSREHSSSQKDYTTRRTTIAVRSPKRQACQSAHLLPSRSVRNAPLDLFALVLITTYVLLSPRSSLGAHNSSAERPSEFCTSTRARTHPHIITSKPHRTVFSCRLCEDSRSQRRPSAPSNGLASGERTHQTSIVSSSEPSSKFSSKFFFSSSSIPRSWQRKRSGPRSTSCSASSSREMPPLELVIV